MNLEKIRWSNGFEQWNLVRFGTPMDGSCLFHAIVNGFFIPYHKEEIRGKKLSRREIIRKMRDELADKLDEIDPENGKKTYYQTINGGNTQEFAKSVQEFTIENMKRVLKSNEFIGYGYIELIGRCINVDIYILEEKRQDIYKSDENWTGGRPSVIVYYHDFGHYELVALEHEDGTYTTFFSPDHSLIQFLKSRK